ncbi:MAG TPA: endolytic transglycosylase MltG, partial [Alphaproteobacteria bacterium]
MRFLLTLVVVLLLGAVAAGVGLKFVQAQITAPGPLAQNTVVFIAPGTGVRAMGTQLQSAGVITQDKLFLGVVALRGIQGRLQAGEYEFPAQIPLAGVIEKMVSGDVLRRMVTIPEGLSSFEAAAIINAAPEMEGTIEPPAEGSILPETYSYIRGDARAKILRQMQAAMTKTLDTLWANRSVDLPIKSKEEALTLASIVEKETRIAAERPRVAGVYINRLNKGMLLQSDPTVIYAITKGASKIDRVLYAHLEIDSPYNTYKNIGLPPGPIANPGAASIAAVLKPEKNDFLYFVADGTGAHIFATNATDHEANVVKWRGVQ